MNTFEFKSCYKCDRPNDPVMIFRDMISLKLEAKTYQSDAEFWMIFLPHPRIEMLKKKAGTGKK